MRIVLCDDDASHLEYYGKKLRALADKHQVPLELVCFTSGKAMLFEFQDPAFHADTVYLDIHMPELPGDQAAAQLREYGYQNDIIFLTVSERHFIDAFNVGALHYVIKDKTSDADFEAIFLRAVKAAEEKDREYVLFTAGGESRNIAVNTIQYFEVQKKIITVYYEDEQFAFYSTMGRLERQLESSGFFRVHKSYLVNLHQIARLTAQEIVLRGGRKIPVSRKYSPLLREAVAQISTPI